MAEIWAVINPTLSGRGEKIVLGLDPLYVKSHHKKFQLRRLRNGRDMGCYLIGTFYIFRMYVFRKYFSEKINYFHFLKCYSVFFQKIIMPFLTFLKKYTSSFQKNISTFFNTQIVKMVKIAVMVSRYAELQLTFL